MAITSSTAVFLRLSGAYDGSEDADDGRRTDGAGRANPTANGEDTASVVWPEGCERVRWDMHPKPQKHKG